MLNGEIDEVGWKIDEVRATAMSLDPHNAEDVRNAMLDLIDCVASLKAITQSLLGIK